MGYLNLPSSCHSAWNENSDGFFASVNLSLTSSQKASKKFQISLAPFRTNLILWPHGSPKLKRARPHDCCQWRGLCPAPRAMLLLHQQLQRFRGQTENSATSFLLWMDSWFPPTTSSPSLTPFLPRASHTSLPSL